MAVRKDTVQLEVIINGSKAGGTLKQMRGSIRDLKRELDKLDVGTEAYNRKAAELAKATAAYNKHTQAIKAQTAAIHGASSKVSPWIDMLKKGAVAALGFFSVQKVIQWGQQVVSWAVKGTAALESMQRKTAIVFGDAIDIVEDYAKINAQSLGVTETQYAALAAQIGDILIPMGFQREEAAQLSSDLINLSGALSEWTNGQRSAEDVAKILSKALTGERESLKELGIEITEADISARLLEKGQNKLTGTMLQQAKAMANYELILERSKDAQDSFASNLDSQARSGNRLSATLKSIGEDLLRRIQPGFKAAASALADFIAPTKQQSDLVAQSKDQFNDLINTLASGNLTYEGRRKVIEQINTQYKDYLPSLITEKTTNEELYSILKDVNAQFDTRISNLIREEKVLDAARKKASAEDVKNEQARRVAEAERLLNKAREENTGQSGLAGSAAKLGVEVAEGRLRIEREKLTKATQDLALAETHLLYVKNNTADADKILARDEELAARKAAAEAARLAEEEKKRQEALAEEARKERERRLQEQLKAIESAARKEQLIRLQALEIIRDDEEAYNAEKQRISIETEIRIAKQSAELYKEGSLERLKYLQEVLDKEAELEKAKDMLVLKQREELIQKEFELRRQALQTEIADEQERTHALEIAELERQQQLAQLKLQGLKQDSAEAIKLQNDIDDRQRLIDRKRLDETLRLTEEGLKERHDLAVIALNEMGLEEEDYQKLRQRLDLEYDIDILQARIARYAENTDERLALERELSDKIRELQQGSGFLVPEAVAGSGGSSSQADQDDLRKKRLEQAADAALSITNNLANAQLAIERNRIDHVLQMELEAIDRTAEAKRKAAGDDAVLLAKIDAEARLAREKAEKKAAQERKKLARKEALIQGALAVIEALPNAAAAIAAGIATGIQLAVIDKQSFYKGGPTGSKGIYKDASGHDVAGVVHTDEYVIPRSITRDPAHQPVISYLEQVRRARGGFAEGGYTTVSTRPVPYVQTMTASGPSAIEQQMLKSLQNIEAITAAWPKVVKAVMAYTDFEHTRDTVEGIREKSRS